MPEQNTAAKKKKYEQQQLDFVGRVGLRVDPGTAGSHLPSMDQVVFSEDGRVGVIDAPISKESQQDGETVSVYFQGGGEAEVVRGDSLYVIASKETGELLNMNGEIAQALFQEGFVLDLVESDEALVAFGAHPDEAGGLYCFLTFEYPTPDKGNGRRYPARSKRATLSGWREDMVESAPDPVTDPNERDAARYAKAVIGG